MKIVSHHRSRLQTASFARHKMAHTLHNPCVLDCNWVKNKHFLTSIGGELQDFCVLESPNFLDSIA